MMRERIEEARGWGLSGGAGAPPAGARNRCRFGLSAVLAALAALGSLGACGAGSDAEEIAARRAVERARVAVEGAERVGAGSTLTATRYLRLAERQLEQARLLLRAGDEDGARSLALRAVADAEVASLLAREAALRAAAQRTQDEASALAGGLR